MVPLGSRGQAQEQRCDDTHGQHGMELEAAEILAGQGINLEVIDLRTLHL